MPDNQTQKDRIKIFISSLGIPTREFEANCSLSNGYISSIRKGIGHKAIEQITERYPNLNAIWLLMGEGEMLRSDKSNTDTLKNAKQENTPSKILEELRENYLVKEERLLAIIESQQEVIKNQSELMKKIAVPAEGNVICAGAVGSETAK